MQPQCDYADMPYCPAHDILSNPELHTVATKILMRTASGLFSEADESTVRTVVTEGFANISKELKLIDPEAMEELSSVHLTESQKDALLTLLEIIDEPRVQSIGLDVAKAIHERARMSGARDDLRGHIEKRLVARREEILALRDALIPTQLLEFLGHTNQWFMTLHPDNLQVMETVSDGWELVIRGEHDHFTAQTLASTRAQRSLDIFAGVLEEGRALLDMIELHAMSLGKQLRVPQLTVSVNYKKGAIGSEPLSCDLQEGELWFIKAILCPLKFGTQGLDALRAAAEILDFADEA